MICLLMCPGIGEVTDVTIAALSCILEAHIDKLLSLKVLRPTGEVHTLQVSDTPEQC